MATTACETDQQILYDICKTELYRDCLVGDIDTFAQDISSNPRKTELLGRVRTLRLYQRDYYLLNEPTYVELIVQGKSQFLGLKEFGNDYYAGLRQAFHDLESADRYLSGPTTRALKTALSKDPSPNSKVFANLERVIMSGEYDTFPWGRSQAEFDIFTRSLPLSPIPLFLANLPNVKHYCQWTPTGPLALPTRIIKMDNPPDIVTIHYPHMLEDWGPQWLPPIVLGTTNRYMFRSNNAACSRDNGESMSFDQLAYFVAPMMTMLGPHPVLHIKSDGHMYIPFDSVSLKNTRLEMYDYIRHRNFLDESDDPPSDLTHIQRLFDERIGRWKGKVFLKNREDCPPCSACGFAGHPKKS
jgi:hypothetical protein